MSSDVTLLLARVSDGQKGAKDELLRVVYDELRQKAAYYMYRQRPDHTLQPTALVHEAYVKMVGSEVAAFQSRSHFFYAAAQAMRQILLDYSKSKNAEIRGGGKRPVDIDGVDVPAHQPDEEPDYEMLDLAMKKLEAFGQRQHQVVMLRYYAGLEVKKIAEMLGVDEKTIQRDWKTAQLVLKAELKRMNLNSE